ncbi:sugar ABC transporter ATP-binding protein [Methylocapsa sp. S129]|uniref:sugar ABC transporter ATP-binding protein n=1 Tax=Methylocapsa sp. S129 TaxID=1641869 RepID=UPI001FED6FDD|nr:sugar ABC transporter ATP-binding protein [Methylocapsa sp. S129]
MKALRGVSLRLDPGSIHALLGENGAGKSTLIKIITGAQSPEGGEICVSGKPVCFANPLQAIEAGIGVVHQERNLIPRFSVGENILLDRIASASLRPINYSAVHDEATHWLRLLELDIDPRRLVSELNVATAQMIEIARALSQQSRILLMDEPTASLTLSETQALFRMLRRLRDQGVAILFVSHKLEEILELCDAVTVLRDGGNACLSRPLAGMSRSDIVSLMIGRAEPIPDLGRNQRTDLPVTLSLASVATLGGHRDIDLDLRSGEIVGLYGLVGAGRSELARAIIGLDRITHGEIRIDGAPVSIGSPREALHRFGIGYVSEDRKQEGVILSHGVLANVGSTVWSRLRGWFGFLRDATVIRLVAPVLSALEVKASSLDQLVENLSGGNQQKVSLAKWLAAGTRVLIVDEPTVGIDVKTKAYFHQLLHKLAREGRAVLVISSDMPELITLSDRIAVMDHYRLVGKFENSGDYGEMSHAIMAYIHAAPPTASLKSQNSAANAAAT